MSALLRSLPALAMAALCALPLSARADDPAPATPADGTKKAEVGQDGAPGTDPPPASPPASPPPAPTKLLADEAQRQVVAKEHFMRGIELIKSRSFDAALIELERSRQAFPTRPATENAGVCLRELGRLDEAEAMFESVLSDFGAVPADVSERIQRQRKDIVALLGVIDLDSSDVGAAVSVDGRPRGKLPLPRPLRLTAGSHRITIRLEGYETFEQTIEVEAGKRLSLKPTLEVMGQVGRLRVREKSGRPATVVVDGVEVGTTPWEGALAPGEHAVWLVGPWSAGAPPTEATVLLAQRADAVLELRELEGVLAVQTTPKAATISLGAVQVGRGVWEGRLPTGKIEVEVAAVGYQTRREWVDLVALQRKTLAIELAPESAAATQEREHPVSLFARVGPLLSPQMVSFACESPCDDGLALGVGLDGGFVFQKSGFGVGATLGYVRVGEDVENRPLKLTPPGKPAQDAAVSDALVLSAFSATALASYHYGSSPFFAIEAGVGGFVGALSDERGVGATDSTGRTYTVGPFGSTGTAAGLTLRPSARLGFALTKQAEAWVEVAGLFLIPLSDDPWAYDDLIPTGADGAARVAQEDVLGPVFAVMPALGISFAP